MATHLTEAEAATLDISSLIRRFRAGEASVEATLARLRRLEAESGEPLRIGSDFANDVEKVIAMRRPGRGDPWA